MTAARSDARNTGSSNTRVIPPPTLQPGRPKVSPSTSVEGGYSAKGPPTCVGRRVDALTLAFQGVVSSSVAEKLRTAATRAHVARQPIAVVLEDGVAVVMNPRSRDGWWHLSTDDMALVVDLEATAGWCVEVKPRATMLARVTPAEAVAIATTLATMLLEVQEPLEGEPTAITARVRRVDLCADFVGFPLADIAREAWIAPRRMRLKEYGTLATFTHAARVTGFAMGRGDVSARVYDKTEELDLPQNAGDKRESEHDRWTAQGWDGREMVTRVEFQVRGDALDQFDLRDPLRLVASLDSLWTYMTRERATRDKTPWLRLSVPAPGRRDRWALDDRWCAVQAVTFRVDEAQPAARSYRRAPAQAARAVSLILGLEAQTSTALTVVDAIEDRPRFDEWSDQQARRYVKETVGGMQLVLKFIEAQEQWGADLVRDRGGPREAARYVYERRRAAKVKARDLVQVLHERRERAALRAA